MTTPVLPNVAFLGRMGTGKSTLAQMLMEHFGYARFSWAAPVKAIAGLAYGPVIKDALYETDTAAGRAIRTGREILQRIGTDAMRRQVDESFWIKAGIRTLELDPLLNRVNDDTRFPNEADALARRGWVLIKVRVPEPERIERLKAIYADIDTANLNHPSETQVDEIPTHLEIFNTTNPYQVALTIMDTLANLVSSR